MRAWAGDLERPTRHAEFTVGRRYGARSAAVVDGARWASVYGARWAGVYGARWASVYGARWARPARPALRVAGAVCVARAEAIDDAVGIEASGDARDGDRGRAVAADASRGGCDVGDGTDL